MHKSPTYGKKVQYVHITRSQAGRVVYYRPTLQTRLVRTLRVNCTTAQTVSPSLPGCVHQVAVHEFVSFYSIHFWYLRLFYSDGFPYFIAPAFSTPAFSAPPTTIVLSRGLRIGPACEAGLSADMRREGVPPQKRKKERPMFVNDFGKCGPILKSFHQLMRKKILLCLYTTKISTSSAICSHCTFLNF